MHDVDFVCGCLGYTVAKSIFKKSSAFLNDDKEHSFHELSSNLKFLSCSNLLYTFWVLYSAVKKFFPSVFVYISI